jgi:hypothetical protein
MSAKSKTEAQNPLILRCQRLMEAFGKSDDERDFFLDRLEGFILYADLEKPHHELELLEKEISNNSHRYCMIPKLTFYETKKIMEGFVNEKVYDIDTKEKLLDIIQSKEARENFLEFIYDHHAELEKWQQYYQERSRIRIIEWLRNNHFTFVFEEDLDFPKTLIEKLKRDLFQAKAGKDVLAARKVLAAKAKTYYSNEALNPRPKRGRPPKQAAKLEIEHQASTDIYTTVVQDVFPFLFTPDYSSSSAVTFSSKFDNEEEMIASRRPNILASPDMNLENLNQKLANLRSLSNRWIDTEGKKTPDAKSAISKPTVDLDFNIDDEDEDEFDGEDLTVHKKRKPKTKSNAEGKSLLTQENSASSKTSSKKNPVKANSETKITPQTAMPASKVAPPAMRSIIKKSRPISEKASPAKKAKKASTNRRIITKNTRKKE